MAEDQLTSKERRKLDTPEKELLWKCYDALGQWDARHNGRPSGFLKAQENAADKLWDTLVSLDAYFFPEETT